jgi:hypothetical protein
MFVAVDHNQDEGVDRMKTELSRVITLPDQSGNFLLVKADTILNASEDNLEALRLHGNCATRVAFGYSKEVNIATTVPGKERVGYTDTETHATLKPDLAKQER